MDSRTDYSNRQATATRGEPMPATEARQASKGKRVLIILLAGLVIAMLAWIPAEWWGASQAPDSQNAAGQAGQQNTIQDSAPASTGN